MKKLLNMFLFVLLFLVLFSCTNRLEVSYAETANSKNDNSIVDTNLKNTVLDQN